MRALLAAVLASGVLPVRAVDAAPAPEPTRILLLGDSVTHGSSGDWTWRYRLWQHLQRVGAPVDFVGPDDGVASYDGAPAVYADPDFDTDHAALWGRWASQGEAMVADLVTDHRPDVLVVNLGVNDLIWGTAPWVVEWQLADLVRNAKEVAPDVDVIIGEVTQTWMTFDGTPKAHTLNAALPDLAARLSTPASRVRVARTADGYVEADTYDSSHPAASGEMKIAAAVADALHDLGVGRAFPRPLASVPSAPRGPLSISVTPQVHAAALAWSPVPGATSYDVSRAVSGEWRLIRRTTDTTMTAAGLRPGARHSLRVQARKGTSAGVAARSRVVPLPAAPRRLRATQRSRTGLELAWHRVPGARYVVSVRGEGLRRREHKAMRPRIVVRGLRPGRRYVVTVRAVVGLGASDPARRVLRTRA